MKFETLPEKAFLENDPTISPIDMLNATIFQTQAIVDCLHVSLTDAPKGCMTNDMITAVLWQVSGNLEIVNRIADTWHKGDCREQNHGPISTSLSCSTSNKQEVNNG